MRKKTRQRNLHCHFVHTHTVPVEVMAQSKVAANLKVHWSGFPYYKICPILKQMMKWSCMGKVHRVTGGLSSLTKCNSAAWNEHKRISVPLRNTSKLCVVYRQGATAGTGLECCSKAPQQGRHYTKCVLTVIQFG